MKGINRVDKTQANQKLNLHENNHFFDRKSSSDAISQNQGIAPKLRIKFQRMPMKFVNKMKTCTNMDQIVE